MSDASQKRIPGMHNPGVREVEQKRRQTIRQRSLQPLHSRHHFLT